MWTNTTAHISTLVHASHPSSVIWCLATTIVHTQNRAPKENGDINHDWKLSAWTSKYHLNQKVCDRWLRLVRWDKMGIVEPGARVELVSL